MDSDKFPFYRAELYHQFHNDFQVRGPGHRSAVGQGQGLGGGSWRVGSVSFLVGLGEATHPHPSIATGLLASAPLPADSNRWLSAHLSELSHAQHRLRAIVQGPAYGTAYNRLQRVLAKEGRLGTTGCPEEAF